MSLLPWLVRAPTGRFAVAAVLLVGVCSLGTLALFVAVSDQPTDANVTVETTELSVRLNDEQPLPDGEGVQTCLASGTPPDSIGVFGTVRVDVPPDHRAARSDELRAVVGLAHTDATTGRDLASSGGAFDLFWLVDDDETLSVGDTAELRIGVRADGERVANATREVVVERDSRTYDC